MDKTTFYTDEILGQNFVKIAESFELVGRGFHIMDARFAHLEGHVADLTKQVAKLTAKTPKKRGVLPYVVAFGLGVYCYKKFKGNVVEFEIGDPKKTESEPPTINGEVLSPLNTNIPQEH